MTDDNEEIFRRAAEHYPLNTGSPDWEALRKKMEANPAPDHTTHKPKKRNYRPLLLLLVLLLLSLLVIEYNKNVLHVFNGAGNEKKIAATPASQDVSTNTEREFHQSQNGQLTPSTANENGKAGMQGATGNDNKQMQRSATTSRDQSIKTLNDPPPNNGVTSGHDNSHNSYSVHRSTTSDNTASLTASAGKKNKQRSY